jgi:hypothetical protein
MVAIKYLANFRIVQLSFTRSFAKNSSHICKGI